jgi:NAD(P)H-dependent FMN reductase
MKLYQNKPMVILATSVGRGGGEHVLQVAKDSAPFFGAEIKASLAIPSFNHTFNRETGQLINPELQAKLKAALFTLTKKKGDNDSN